MHVPSEAGTTEIFVLNRSTEEFRKVVDVGVASNPVFSAGHKSDEGKIGR